MKRLWIAFVIATCVSSIHFAGEAEFRSKFVSSLINALAIAAFPGTAIAQILAAVVNSPRIVGSPAYAFLVSIVFNALFYWAILIIVGKTLGLGSRQKEGQRKTV